MKKIILIIGCMTLWASVAMGQQTQTTELQPFEGRFGPGWYGEQHRGNTMAGEYSYLKTSTAGVFDLEWDPLPHRFVLESYYLNPKDYFGEVDYSYRDVVLMNLYTRGLFHNLNHYRFGPDDPATISPSFEDSDASGVYGIENKLSRGFIRLKTPDFPFHLYADARTIGRDGTIQQRFMKSGGLNLVSTGRDINWDTREYRVGLNSHLGPIEADYSHTEKRFEALGQKVLFDAGGIPHNLVPDLESAWDSIKIHTSYAGKFVLSGTYTVGDKKNEDSAAKAEFTNTAGDLMFMPVTSVILTVRYRHYDLDVTNPDTVTVTGLGTYNVRDSISSARDVVSGVLRYRATDRLTVRGEYSADQTDRTRGQEGMLASPIAPAYWVIAKSTTKNTAKLGITYRVMNKMNIRTDFSQTTVDNPAYPTDPDDLQAARAVVSWSPSPWLNTMVSYGTVRESRDQLVAPLGGGKREASRDQALASATMLLGRRSSVTVSYGFYQNGVEQTLTFQDGAGAYALEPDVPYTDTAHVGSVSFTVVPIDMVNVVAAAHRSYSRGAYEISGATPNTGGISQYSQLKVIDTVFTAGAEIEFTRFMTTEVRYEHRTYDDQIDDTEDGTAKTVLAMLSLKW